MHTLCSAPYNPRQLPPGQIVAGALREHVPLDEPLMAMPYGPPALQGIPAHGVEQAIAQDTQLPSVVADGGAEEPRNEQRWGANQRGLSLMVERPQRFSALVVSTKIKLQSSRLWRA